MVNILLKKYRLLLALVTGFLVVALQCSGASSAFARGATAGGVSHVTSALTTVDCGNPPVHDSCAWGGNQATGARGTYRGASVTFTVPKITGNDGDHVAFWAGVGGDQLYSGTNSWELVQAGIESYISGGVQHNFAWYEYVGTSGTILPVTFSFTKTIKAGDEIFVFIRSNYQASGVDYFYVEDETNNEHHDISVTGHLSDSATGECVAERVGSDPIAKFGTETLSGCDISTNTDAKYIGGWPVYWSHIVDTSGDILVRVGSIDNYGDFTLTWAKAS